MATICCSRFQSENVQFENVQTVLFDKDGTLANVENYLKALGEARLHFINKQAPGLQPSLLAAFGLQHSNGTEGGIDPAGLMAVGSRRENEVAAAAYVAASGQSWVAALEMVSNAFQKAEASLPQKITQTVPIAGAAELLQQLKQSGLKLGIVSSDVHAEVEAFIEHYQLPGIDWYCGAAAETLPKTHPDFLTFVCRAMDANPETTVIVGDSAADLQMASQGAAGFIAMTGGWRSPPSIEVIKHIQTDLAITVINQLSQVESYN